MNIADNLQHLETHYIKVWIHKWQQELNKTNSETERTELQANIRKAEDEISRRNRDA